MFFLRIHSVSSATRPPLEFSREGDSTATSSSRCPKVYTRIQVLRGIVHLYRIPLSLSSSNSDHFLPASRGTLLFVLAVPDHLSPEDFLRFCGSYADRSTAIQFIRSDKDRYSVLVNLENEISAEAFYLNLNGWRFSSSKGEICHILFLDSVECTESAEIAGTPPLRSTELPTCPTCIVLLQIKVGQLFLFGVPNLSRTFSKAYLLFVQNVRKSLDMSHMWPCWMWKIMDEYKRLLVSQLENQRVHYETLLEDAKQKWERCISEAMDGAVGSKIQDVQLEIRKINENLTNSQIHWREKIEEIEQRTISSEMSSSQSSASKGIKKHRIYCECNLECMTLTCYRGNNRGRRFYRCPRNRSEHDCNYFNWMDEVDDTLFDKDYAG